MTSAKANCLQRPCLQMSLAYDFGGQGSTRDWREKHKIMNSICTGNTMECRNFCDLFLLFKMITVSR